MSFNKHIQNVAQKSTKLIHMLGRSARLHWGLGHKSLKTIYEGAIIPLITYGAPVWADAAQKRRNLNKLQSVQRLINIKIAKAYRTISFEASCVIAGVLPIGLIIEEKAQLYRLKQNWTGNEQEYDLPLPAREWPHPAHRINICGINTHTSYSVKIFTDGSKIDDKVGAGVAIFLNETLIKQCRYKLGRCCSNNQAEAISVLKALEELKKLTEYTHNKRVAIFTDSKVTLDSLKNNSIVNPIILQTRAAVRQLMSEDWIIHFEWVKAHIGIKGNEMADKLAKEAAEDEQLCIIYNRTPLTSAITEQRKDSIIKWQHQWDITTKGATCKSFLPKVESRLKLKIPITAEFTSIITGHGKTKAYLHRFKLIDNSQCPCNKGEQTSDHIIYNCEKIENEREILKQQITTGGGTWPPTKDQLIAKHL